MSAARRAPPRRIWRAATIPAVVLARSTTVTSAVLAAKAVIMGGTGHPLSVPQHTPTFITDYVNGADRSYIAPSGLCSGGRPGCTLLAVYTPEQFRHNYLIPTPVLPLLVADHRRAARVGAWRPQQAGLVDCGRVQESLDDDAVRGW
jgi:hypothetical protein